MTPICQSATDAAKRMRQELKAHFPGVKFSVRTAYFAGGDSIRIAWDLGPTTTQVERITDKYQEGSFDGMTDSYTYEPTLMINKEGEVQVLGGAKYVFANRSIPQEVELQMFHDLAALLGVTYSGDRYQLLYPKDGWSASHNFQHLLCRILSKSDLTKGYHGLRRTAVTCGSGEDFYEMVQP